MRNGAAVQCVQRGASVTAVLQPATERRRSSPSRQHSTRQTRLVSRSRNPEARPPADPGQRTAVQDAAGADLSGRPLCVAAQRGKEVSVGNSLLASGQGRHDRTVAGQQTLRSVLGGVGAPRPALGRELAADVWSRHHAAGSGSGRAGSGCLLTRTQSTSTTWLGLLGEVPVAPLLRSCGRARQVHQ